MLEYDTVVKKQAMKNEDENYDDEYVQDFLKILMISNHLKNLSSNSSDDKGLTCWPKLRVKSTVHLKSP